MYVNWKALFSFGLAFWGILCCTDLLGDSTWKRCSHNIEDILTGYYNEISEMQAKSNDLEVPNQKLSWPTLLWNVCAFLCSLVFCSMLRSMSWIIWKVLKIYNIFRNRKAFTTKVVNNIQENEISPSESDNVLLKKQISDNLKMQEFVQLELEEIKKEKDQLAQQLMIAQKENLTSRQQIEEYKLETFMMKEKLARTANSLRENLKYKDFANANQELISKKAQSLEMHLKEMSRDRDLLRSKLSLVEKTCSNLEEKLKVYEKQDSGSNIEPEKDISERLRSNEPSEVNQPEIDICKFQKKIIELQKTIGTFEGNGTSFEGNSKISVDLEDSSLSTSKDSDTPKRADLNTVRHNIFNYNAYKTQMLRPKLKLSELRETLYGAVDTGSSSDENSSSHRIISSTVEFQNFLKSLTRNQL